MPMQEDAFKILEVYETFLKTMRPRIPKGIGFLVLLIVTVLGVATLYHRVFNHALLPNEVELIHIVFLLGFFALVLLPAINTLRQPPPNRLAQYKAQLGQDETYIRSLRACSLAERRRFQKVMAEEWRLEEKQAELWAFVFALVGSLILAFAHGLGAANVPYPWLLLLVSVMAVSVHFAKWQVARKRRFEGYLEATQEHAALPEIENAKLVP